MCNLYVFSSFFLTCPRIRPSHFQSRVVCFSIFVTKPNCIWKRFYSIFLRWWKKIKDWMVFGKQCKGESGFKNFCNICHLYICLHSVKGNWKSIIQCHLSPKFLRHHFSVTWYNFYANWRAFPCMTLNRLLSSTVTQRLCTTWWV